MPDNGKKKNKIIIIAAAVVVVVAAIVAAIMILKPTPLDDKFFVSDNTKLVYNVGKEIYGGLYDSTEIYMVYNYSGDTITKLTTYYGYENEEMAKAAADKYADIFKPGDEIEEVKIDGRFICLTAKPEIYEGTTVDSVKTIIDFQTKGDEGVEDYIEDNIIEDADVTIEWDD